MDVNFLISRFDSGISDFAGDLSRACVDLRYDALTWLWILLPAILIQATVMMLETLAQLVWT